MFRVTQIVRFLLKRGLRFRNLGFCGHDLMETAAFNAPLQPPVPIHPERTRRFRQGRKQAFSRLRAFPRLNGEARRAEAFAAKRLAQRFVAGFRHTSCTKMHYSPRNKPKRDPSPTTVFLCSVLPLPFLLSSPPPGARPARANGGRSGWHRDLPANEPGTPVA